MPRKSASPNVSVDQAIKELEAGTYASAPKGSDQAVLAANLRTSLARLGVTTLAV